MYLFFDTETTGLPKEYRAKTEDVDNWPRVVQLAWALYDENEYLVQSRSDIILQDIDQQLSKEVQEIHGITNKMVVNFGIHLPGALAAFERVCECQAEYLIAHNIYFDRKVLGAEFVRQEEEIAFDHLTKICTMNQSTKHVGLKQSNGKTPKWPKLEELYFKLFQENLENQHNAMVDVLATAKCFFELKRLGIIDLEKIKEKLKEKKCQDKY